jgi:hypothetical protein
VPQLASRGTSHRRPDPVTTYDQKAGKEVENVEPNVFSTSRTSRTPTSAPARLDAFHPAGRAPERFPAQPIHGQRALRFIAEGRSVGMAVRQWLPKRRATTDSIRQQWRPRQVEVNDAGDTLIQGFRTRTGDAR